MNTKQTLGLGGVLVVVACAANQTVPAPTSAPTSTVDFRQAQPKAGPIVEVDAPIPERRQLANGLVVFVVPKHDLPLVSVSILFKAGSSADPQNLAGLAGFLGDMLRAGTKTRSAQTIADEVETQGAALSVRVDEDSLALSSTSLATRFVPVFNVMADIVRNSTFSPAEVERVRKQRLGGLAEEDDDPESLAARVIRETVFDAHPYGHTTLGNAHSVAKITQADLITFAHLHLRPANTAIAVVGDLTPEQAFAEVEKRFGEWQGPMGENAAPSAPTAQPPRVVLVERPGAPQSQVMVGDLGVARNSSDYFATLVMNSILGGVFNSRLNMNLREAKGYTYGAYSNFEANREVGLFVAGAAVRTDVTLLSVQAILAEIDGMRSRDVSDEELAGAKDGFALSLPARFQTIGAITNMIGNIFVYDFPLDYYRQLPTKIRAVTRDDVRRAAAAHLTPSRLSIVVVGDPSQVAEGLESLGRGKLRVQSNPKSQQ